MRYYGEDALLINPRYRSHFLAIRPRQIYVKYSTERALQKGFHPIARVGI